MTDRQMAVVYVVGRILNNRAEGWVDHRPVRRQVEEILSSSRTPVHIMAEVDRIEEHSARAWRRFMNEILGRLAEYGIVDRKVSEGGSNDDR